MLEEAHGIGEFLGEMRDRTFKNYDAFTVGEVFNEKPEEIPEFIGENGYFSSMFDFNETICGGSENRFFCLYAGTGFRQCIFHLCGPRTWGQGKRGG